MPFMDGLTFAKEAKKLLPLVRIIFISGFDDFDYAKQRYNCKLMTIC